MMGWGGCRPCWPFPLRPSVFVVPPPPNVRWNGLKFGKVRGLNLEDSKRIYLPEDT